MGARVLGGAQVDLLQLVYSGLATVFEFRGRCFTPVFIGGAGILFDSDVIHRCGLLTAADWLVL